MSVCFLEGRKVSAVIVYLGTQEPPRVFQVSLCLKGCTQISPEYFFIWRVVTYLWEGSPCHSLEERTYTFAVWAMSFPDLQPVLAGHCRKKPQAPRCSGSSPHLCLITSVPAGPLGELPEPNPGPEPGLDARGKSPAFISRSLLTCGCGSSGRLQRFAAR